MSLDQYIVSDKEHSAKTIFSRHINYEFPNGFGASVVYAKKGPNTPNSLFDAYSEIAVIKDGKITYSTSITNDVIRTRDKEDELKILKSIYELEASS